MSTEGPAPLARLVAELSRLPGIGQRTAQRLAFHILRAPDEEASALGDAIREVKEKVGLCEQCFNLAEGPLCRICADTTRDRTTICVVEEPGDVIPIERTHEYRGLYHVLGGASRRSTAIDAEDLKIAELLRAGRGAAAPPRWSSPPTRPRPARRPPSTSPNGCAARSPSPAWPAACRSAPTSSTPTR